MALPPRPIRTRNLNAALDMRSFPPMRDNILPIDNMKLKHVPEGKVRTQQALIANIKSKPFQTKKVVQKNNVINKQALRIAANPELNFPTQKLPASINRLAAQKKKLLAAQKANASIPIAKVEDTPTVPRVKKITQILNREDQKTKAQDKVMIAQNSKVENVISFQTEVVENETSSSTVKIQVDSTPEENIKPQNTPKTKNTTEVVKKNNTASQETNTPLEPQKNGKELPLESAEKQKEEESKKDMTLEETYVLEPQLERAVKEELQDIMIQVWQELPDDPSEEEERMTVDKFRNEAGDDLRRVLGLNITKRLLNVFNKLFVKMQFTCRPQMGCLTSFLKEYHINKFKRIEMDSNTFAAQMESIEDFDRLCAAKELMCGEAKISVTPCYKFTQCPKNLKTIYDDTYFYEDTSQVCIESPKGKTEIQNTQALKLENVIRCSTKTDNIEDPDKVDKTKIVNVEKIVCSNTEEVKKKSIKVDVEKPSDNKSNDIGITAIIKNEKPISKDINAYILKDKFQNDIDDEDLDLDIPECQMEGEDELDDEDILALMSEGVVLDECSGSEDER